MKRLLILFLIVFVKFSCFSQCNVQLGNGFYNVPNTPIYGLYNYSQSGFIYNEAELAAIGIYQGAVLMKIEFEFSGWATNYAVNNQTLKLAHVLEDWFPSLTNAGYSNLTISNITIVKNNFNDSINNSWKSFTFDTPFTYNGGNLLISWENYDGSWAPNYGWLEGSYNVNPTTAVWFQDNTYPHNLSPPNTTYNLHPNIRFELLPTSNSIAVSNCDSYTAPDGTVYTSTGNYTAVIPNAAGCDSTITIDLTITNSNTGSETVTECNSYTWSTNGQTYTQSGQYTEVLTNQSGCDSTVTLNLTITNLNTGSETLTECDSYTWNTNGQTYTQSGQYTSVLTNQSGCDSTVTLNLTITNSNTGSETVSECDSYTWNTNGQTYTQSGQYTEVLTNQSGCDSTVTLNLTITNSNTGSETLTECDSYTWNTNGQTYTQSGQYTSVLTNQSGCDSTVTLNLTINSSSSSTQTDSGVDSYTWSVNNQTYTQSGTYTAVVPNASGCDSTITLDLTLQFTGLDENESSYVAVYPNPTYNSFTLSTKDMIHMNYTLVDIQGKVVLKGIIESTEETVDISKLSKGQYNLVFEDESISPISIIKN